MIESLRPQASHTEGKLRTVCRMLVLAIACSASAAPVFATAMSAAKARVAHMNEQECARLKQSGEAGTADQQLLLGLAYLTGGCGLTKDPVQTALLFRLAASSGNSTAELGLADLYMRGEGVAKNEMQAVSWIRKAAEAGDGDAQAAMGQAYQEGSGVPKDPKQAMDWYQKGALTGNAESQYLLGAGYFHGISAPKDYEEAIKWLRRAADANHYTAMALLGRIYMERGIPAEEAQILPLAKRSAEAGDVEGELLYGDMLSHGMADAPKDLTAARQWYEKASLQGSEKAKEQAHDLDKLAAVRANEAGKPSSASVPAAPRVDRSIPAQKVNLEKMGVSLEIHDASQRWHSQVLGSGGGTDVLISDKGLKVAVSLIEDVPCQKKTELFSPTVTPNRAYIPPGWYHMAGEQTSGPSYVGDLCLHFAKGLVSGMVVSPQPWDSPLFTSVVPALDAVRVAVVERWGEDHSESSADLVPFPPEGASPARPQTAQTATLAAQAPPPPSAAPSPAPGGLGVVTHVSKIYIDSTEVDVSGRDAWGTMNMQGSNWSTWENPPVIIQFIQSRVDCAESMRRLKGDSPNRLAPGWYKTMHLVRNDAGNYMYTCLDVKGKTVVATVATALSPGDPQLEPASEFLSSVAAALEAKFGKR